MLTRRMALSPTAATWCVLLGLCVAEARAQMVYDFSVNTGVDRFAYKNAVPRTPIPPTVNNIPSSELTSTDYTAISASDDGDACNEGEACQGGVCTGGRLREASMGERR